LVDEVGEDERGEACGTEWGKLKKREHLEDLGVDGKITLK
jgi:hypothetical protein